MPRAGGSFTRAAAARELHRIARWWMDNTLDTDNGGFVGQVNCDGRRLNLANKGLVLNSRILWFFSELSAFDDRPGYFETAQRAFDYLLERFDDPLFGGAVWEVAADGSLVNGKKQVYALAFCIYAFTAWFRLTADARALGQALAYFELIETKARDRLHGGYIEALSRDWQTLEDVRLGADDMNAPKTMNSHLHLLEAYSSLHLAAPSPRMAEALEDVIDLITDRIFDPQRGHLAPFFDSRWNRLSSNVSFGHDIEASWLLCEAAEALGDPGRAQRVRAVAGELAERCLKEGTGSGGQLCEGFEPVTHTRSETSIWWIQAEAIVGFLNAFQLTGEAPYRMAMERVWQHVEEQLLDEAVGEWRWQSPVSHSGGTEHYQAGFWKGPYHNGRAMLEACRRFDALGES